MDITIEKVDADTARTMLAANTNNRRLNARRVAQLAGAIKRGEWALNGEAVKFGEDGRLLDGQHRLAAIAQAEMPIETVVVRGLPDETQETVDTGLRRSLGDMLSMRGYSYTGQTASAARLVYAYDAGLLSKRGNSRKAPTAQQLLSLIEDNLKAFTSAAQKGDLWYRHTKVNKTMATAAIFILRRIDIDEADQFINQVIYGEGLLDGSPALTLRNRLIRDLGARPRPRTENQLALVVKAWNAWRTDRPIQVLRWRPYGDLSESFPMAA